MSMEIGPWMVDIAVDGLIPFETVIDLVAERGPELPEGGLFWKDVNVNILLYVHGICVDMVPTHGWKGSYYFFKLTLPQDASMTSVSLH